MFFQLVSKCLGDNYMHLYAESEMLYSDIRTPGLLLCYYPLLGVRSLVNFWIQLAK